MRALPSVLLALGLVIPRVTAGVEDDIAPYLALFFFIGYVHEWNADLSPSTIGGRDCRGTPRCNFDEFLDATTTSQGGYEGGVVPNLLSGASAKRNADSIRRAGMTRKIEFDPQKLIVGAPSDKKVVDDHIVYVLNAFKVDSGSPGASRDMFDQAVDALRNIGEITAGYASTEHVRWWMSVGSAPPGTDFSTIELPTGGSESESEGRAIVDVINMAKTWGYEVPGDIAKIPVWKGGYTVPSLELARGFGELRLAIRACRRGEDYPVTPT
ncbi:hypothetical protein NM208_g17116 [Fusarium decemcellulare]|uniref:Uncharacterized protein n=1 Tax=Fusarium decemcellulare TaxID=57161 RepID=A0ACC1RBP0_9HYPO|nr:hypothetical protein NM208_g17116 [Fusarium decemcellulare]